MLEESSRQEMLLDEAVPPSLSTIIYHFLMSLLEKSGSSNAQQSQAGQGLKQIDLGEGVPARGRGCNEMSPKPFCGSTNKASGSELVVVLSPKIKRKKKKYLFFG